MCLTDYCVAPGGDDGPVYSVWEYGCHGFTDEATNSSPNYEDGEEDTGWNWQGDRNGREYELSREKQVGLYDSIYSTVAT